MNIRDQIIHVLKEYAAGKYDTKTFCDVFCELYYYESSGHRFFYGKEKDMLDELAKVAERYSPFPNEVVNFEYNSENEVKEKFNEIIKLLNIDEGAGR